jgi:hypothetical protein
VIPGLKPLLALIAATLLGSCGGAPIVPEPRTDRARLAPRARDVPDDCTPQPGKPPPQPLEREYTGLARSARCQREVYTIMGGVTHFLGVKCTYCHLAPDYRAMTHRKRVANWMASELIPRLTKKTGGELWCNDCHQATGRGVAKILGNPRDESWAIEFMTTHLVENLATRRGEPLRCKMCHGGRPGSPEFRRKIILTGSLPVK